MNREAYLERIASHYRDNWNVADVKRLFRKGPYWELPQGFHVLEFSPTDRHDFWIYATCGMSLDSDDAPLEVHVFSQSPDEENVELLTTLAHFHRTAARLDIGHHVKIGRPWTPGSQCDRGYLSLPYLDGPNLEWLRGSPIDVRNLWFVPITPDESVYMHSHGIEALEALFEESNFNYADPGRPSVI
jgi:hypothetical protein